MSSTPRKGPSSIRWEGKTLTAAQANEKLEYALQQYELEVQDVWHAAEVK